MEAGIFALQLLPFTGEGLLPSINSSAFMLTPGQEWALRQSFASVGRGGCCQLVLKAGMVSRGCREDSKSYGIVLNIRGSWEPFLFIR